MENWTIEDDELSNGNDRPALSVDMCVDFCLKRLSEDKTKSLTDEVVHNLTFDELIGALLKAKDLIDICKEESEL